MSGVAGLTTKEVQCQGHSHSNRVMLPFMTVVRHCCCLRLPSRLFLVCPPMEISNSNVIPWYILKVSFRLEFGIPAFSRPRASLSHKGLAIAHLKSN